MKLNESKDISREYSVPSQNKDNRNRALKRRISTLEQQNQLLSNVIRCLQPQLHAILGLSEVLDEDTAVFGHNNYVQKIREASATISSWTDRVNDYLDLNENKVFVKEQRYPLKNLVKEVDMIMQPWARQRQTPLKFIFSDNLPLQIVTDIIYLRFCLLQLTEKAIITAERKAIDVIVTGDIRGDQLFARFDFMNDDLRQDLAGIDIVIQGFCDRSANKNYLVERNIWELILIIKYVELLGGELTLCDIEKPGSAFSLLLPVDLPAPKLGKRNNEPGNLETQGEENTGDALLARLSRAFEQIRRSRQLVKSDINGSISDDH